MVSLQTFIPSQRAQWSAFFATIYLMAKLGSYGDEYALLGGFVGAFLLFYFPVYWIYSFDFVAFARRFRDSNETTEG